jgi:hypothetical protein
MVERIEVRKVGQWEVVMTNKTGFWFPMIIDGRVVKFQTLDQATDWLMGLN